MKRRSFHSVIKKTVFGSPLLLFSLTATVICAVIFALLPPLVLEKIINSLVDKKDIPLTLALTYFALLAVSGLFNALKETLITVFGQKTTHIIRSEMCAKLSRLYASYYTSVEPGVTAARFVGDVDAVEALFASGVIGMTADAFQTVGILAVIFIKSKGLGILLLLTLPLIFLFTRVVQKRMLRSQLENRVSLGNLNNFIPETVKNIRMIHIFGKEAYMENKYNEGILKSYRAVNKSNFYDAVYSPVILVISAVIVAVMMIFSISGGEMQAFFGMSVGTAVAIIAYVGKVFGPIESIGMEIQSIQSAFAGVKRISEFLDEPERAETDKSITAEKLFSSNSPAVEVGDVTFGYSDDTLVLDKLSFTVNSGDSLTLIGRTGAGKSTLFKLILGLYTPKSGKIKIFGTNAAEIPDNIKRQLFGYVEQSFHPVKGTVAEQISVFSDTVSKEAIVNSAILTGIHEAIEKLPNGYDTVYNDNLFSQGQKQLLSITRAVASDPKILLLDEITANLDSETEETVLAALKNASEKRTVISISHRLFERTGGAVIEILSNSTGYCDDC